MSSTDIPASVRAARAGFDAAGLVIEQCDDDGMRLRALAAMQLSGIMLVSGAGAMDLAAWIIDGLDISSRLVVHHEGELDPAKVRGCFNNDLRVTAHVQPLESFLDDVKQHRFALFVLTDVDAKASTLDRVTQSIADGGVLVLAGVPKRVIEKTQGLDGFCLMHSDERQTIFVQRHPGNRPQRRGRRRRNRV